MSEGRDGTRKRKSKRMNPHYRLPKRFGGIDENGRAYVQVYPWSEASKGNYNNPVRYYLEDFEEDSLLYSLLMRNTILYIIRRDYKRGKAQNK